MAIIDVVKWDGAPNIYAYKYPETNLTTFTQLIVNESQEAVLFSKGKLLQKFGSGKHTLSTENIPILETLFGIPFGGQNPFTAEVWFVNKVASLNTKWGTNTPMQLRDPEFGVMIPVRAFGQFGIQIKDAETFLVKLVGTMSEFNDTNLIDYFRGVILATASTQIAQIITNNKIGLLSISSQLLPISTSLKEQMKLEFETYGIDLLNFFVNSITTPDNDPSIENLKGLLAKKAEMDLLGYTYQQERTFDVLENASKNEGNSGSIMGAGMGLSMGMGVGSAVGGMMNDLRTQVPSNSISAKATIQCPSCKATIPGDSKFCAICGKTVGATTTVLIKCNKCQNDMPANSKFCPSCGDVYNACPVCGADNAAEAANCVACGAGLPAACPNCNAKVVGNMKFCPSCGGSLQKLCSKCGNEIQQGFKFCGSCGEKVI